MKTKGAVSSFLVVAWLCVPTESAIGGDATRTVNHFHGNFCGANYPFVTGTRSEMANALHAIPALDNLDEACKQHDICYVAIEGHATICDQQLIEEVDQLKLTAPAGCSRLSRMIRSAFVALPGTAAGNPIQTGVHALSSPLFTVLVSPIAGLDVLMESSSDDLRCNGPTAYSAGPPGSTSDFMPVPEPSSKEGSPAGISRGCFRRGILAYNVASNRNRKDDIDDVKDAIAKGRTADEIVSAEDGIRIVDGVYKFGTLNNRTHMLAEIYYCSADERNDSHLKALDAARESLELCQSIDRWRTHAACVAYVVANKIP